MSLYRHLNVEERAPLPLVLKHANNVYCSFDLDRDAYQANLAVTHVLHQFGWRKREFCNALRARARAAGLTASVISKRSIYNLLYR